MGLLRIPDRDQHEGDDMKNQTVKEIVAFASRAALNSSGGDGVDGVDIKIVFTVEDDING